MRRQVIVGLADTHGGHNQGLLNPDTVLERDDESGKPHRYNPQLTPFQEMIYADYSECMDRVINIADNDEIILIHDGDLTQGNRFEENWVSSRLSDQIIIAYHNLKPWMKYKNIKIIRVAKGTGAHVYKEGSSEILVSKLLQNEFKDKDITAVYHGLLTTDNFSVDYAHHGPSPGTREWLKGNMGVLYLKDIMKRSLKRGVRPPDLVLRAHFHEYSHVNHIEQWGDNDEYISTLVTLPSFCGGGDNGIKASRSRDTLQIGMCAFEIVDGKLHNIHRLFRTYDIRSEEKIEWETTCENVG